MLENSTATVFGLIALILAFGEGLRAHFNPVVGIDYEDWALDDPHGQGIEAVRQIRDEIGRRVRTLLGELGSDK